MTEEYAFISCLLTKPELLSAVVSKVKPEYIEDSFCKSVYSEMINQSSFNLPSIHKALSEKITFKELVDTSDLIKFVTKNIVDGYGCYIVGQWKSKRLKEIASCGDVDKAIADIESLKSIEYFDDSPKDESEEFLKVVEQKMSGKIDERTLPTGFTNIDDTIEGFKKSEFIVIGGRPGSGKTTWGMNCAYKMAKKGFKVLFCSIEMGITELHERLNKSITRINDYKNINQYQFDEIVKVSRDLKNNIPIDIYDKPGMLLEDIFYKARNGNYDVVFIDHLSILKSSKIFPKRYEEISYITAKLKELSRELDIPVVCLCQLNRSLDAREIKAPTLTDLRDSGTIEQDADIVGFIYRAEYHLKDKEPDDKNSLDYKDWEEAMQEAKGKAQFIVAKNRRGMLGRFNMGFDGANYLFYERY